LVIQAIGELVSNLGRLGKLAVVLGVVLTLAPAAISAARPARARQGTTTSSPASVAATHRSTARQTSVAPTKRTKPTYSAAAARARRVRLSRALAAARARELAILAQPRFKTDAQGDVVPDIRAEAAIIYNPATGQVLWEERAFDPRSIASITKVMTAVCVLDDNPDLTDEVVVDRADTRGASVTHLRAGERVSRADLLRLLLIASDNAAARTLARTSSLGMQAFVARMNEKATELGLQGTHYVDPSGLFSENISSAYDMARLIAYAAEDEMLSGIMRTQEYSFRTSRRAMTIHSTNRLLQSPDIDVRGGKTGFISQSGYCLATLLRLPDLNQTVAVVVLGARSNAGRFWETRHLLDWITSRAHALVGRDGQLPQ
jgi:D-alanyl-D-alanine endopeptidase (penicillin-binding protein 7)